MKLSARNQFKGKVVEIKEGAVNGTVKIDIGGGNIISSVITMASIKELGSYSCKITLYKGVVVNVPFESPLTNTSTPSPMSWYGGITNFIATSVPFV